MKELKHYEVVGFVDWYQNSRDKYSEEDFATQFMKQTRKFAFGNNYQRVLKLALNRKLFEKEY